MEWLAILLTGLLITVMAFDVTRYLIPNWLVMILLALYPLHLFTAPVAIAWWWSLLIGLAMFAIGYLLFALRSMGGGDVKLLAVLGLWAGTTAALEFLIYTAVLGGILSVMLLLGRPVATWVEGKFFDISVARRVPRVLMVGEPAPYGLAIAGGFLIVLWAGKIPGLPLG